jgi:hypothetical protein
MDDKREDIEELRLLRAFSKITDPAKRRKILELAEKYAPPESDERPVE